MLLKLQVFANLGDSFRLRQQRSYTDYCDLQEKTIYPPFHIISILKPKEQTPVNLLLVSYSSLSPYT